MPVNSASCAGFCVDNTATFKFSENKEDHAICLAIGAHDRSFSPAWGELPAEKRVLIVVSNIIDMGDVEAHDARNNLWEVAPPYHVFLAHGYEVDFVSPKGGAVQFSMDPVGISSYTIK